MPTILAGDFNIDNPLIAEYFPVLFANGFSETALVGPTNPKGKYLDHVLLKGLFYKNQRSG